MKRGALSLGLFIIGVSFPLAAGARPAPQDTTLHNRTLVVPFEPCGNLAFVPVRVNGSDTLTFLIDSGANACVIDLRRATELKLKRLEQVEGSGAGKGPVDTWILDNKRVTFSLPGLDLHADLVAALDLSNNLPVLGRRVDGILGYDLLDRFLVELDYDSQVLLLSPPESVLAPASGVALPLVFSNRLPHVEVTLTPAGHAPMRQTLLIDSGSNDAVDDSVLAFSTSPLIETVSGVGQGKEFRSMAGRWESVDIGTLHLTRVPGGAGGVPLIGGEVLRRFTVIFDFHHRQIILKPNRHFTDAFLEDASGLNLRLVPESGMLRVHDVALRSPAAECGVRVDDLLLGIDGAPVPKLGLDRIQRLFQEPGRSYRLHIGRNQDEFDVLLMTRTLL
jgi:aspartyl protease/PDZ domain-containing protein